jgi:hypothetical protein
MIVTEASYITKLKEKNFAPKEKMMKPLPNSIKRKHPSKGEKKKQRARTKVQAGKPPKRGWVGHTEERKPLSIKTPFTSCMKHIN